MRSDKNPYKIKFDSKQKLLDMPAKAKKWNLMANHSDKTLLRTLLAMKISTLFEMSYTPNVVRLMLWSMGNLKEIIIYVIKLNTIKIE